MIIAQSSARLTADTECHFPTTLLGTLIECMEEDLCCSEDLPIHQEPDSPRSNFQDAPEDPDVEAVTLSSRPAEFEVRMHRKSVILWV